LWRHIPGARSDWENKFEVKDHDQGHWGQERKNRFTYWYLREKMGLIDLSQTKMIPDPLYTCRR